jgi:tetratricopeptide (TPR) repeat protein
VAYIQITDWRLLNLAEKQQRDGYLRQATAAYEKVLRQLDRAEPGESAVDAPLDRALLVRCRLIRAYDALGRFDRAATLFVEVVDRMPAAAETMRPKRVPEAGSLFLVDAGKAIDELIARRGEDDVSQSLEAWRDSWPAGPVASSAPVGGTPEARQQTGLAKVRSFVERGLFDNAIEAEAKLRPTLHMSKWAESFYWRGMALRGRSETRQAEEAARDRRRAGLAWMRVVIHFPGHRLAPASLYEVAAVCEQLGREDQAVMLWAELIRRYPDAGEPIARAEKAIQTVNKKRAAEKERS